MRLFYLTTIYLVILQACSRPVTPQLVDENEDIVDQQSMMLQRALMEELDTPYAPPPGRAEVHHACGFAKILCSGVFITGLDMDFTAEAIGYFSSPYEERQKVLKRTVDMEKQMAIVTLQDGTEIKARYLGDQGCVCMGVSETLHFEPKSITKNLPDAETTPWPVGDYVGDQTFPSNIDKTKIQEAVDAAFNPAGGLTAGFIITYKGQIIGERYKDEIDMHTPLESWSMGKSLTAMMMGVLINAGVYRLDQSAPVPEWQSANDPRQEIKIQDIMRMSSGIRFRAPQDPDFDPDVGYPDHLYVYTGATNSFAYAASLGQQWKPNTIGRYRNCDPVLTNYLVRLGVEGLGQDYHSFPQREIFDKIGVRNMIMETDPYGNFLLQGYEFSTPRDWARLGNLVLQDGVWNGERILYEGYLEHAMKLAPAWEADGRPIYGGNFCWINGEGDFNVPKESIFFAGAGGQFTIIVPSHDLVVVRLGHYKGASIGRQSLNNALRGEPTAFINLFGSDWNDEVACYRIPAMVTAANGDVLVTIDERVPSCGDLKWSGDINIVMRRSKDSGTTWTDIERLVDYPEGESASDPSMIVDHITKDIFLFYNYMNHNKEKDVYYLHVMKSSDHGQSWTKPIDITSQIAKPDWHNDFKFITSGRGISTSKGKLLHTMVNLDSGMHVFGSDDHGDTWYLIDQPITPANESKLVELSNGDLMVNARVNGGGLRYVHVSGDEGKSWVSRADSVLVDPGCNASIINYGQLHDVKKKDWLIFSNANRVDKRENLTIRYSVDDGESWSAGKVLYPGPSAYSTMTVLENGDIGVVFEMDDYKDNVFVRVSPTWFSEE